MNRTCKYSREQLMDTINEVSFAVDGPLTIDTAEDTCSRQWDWVMQPWPWEGV